MTLPLATPLTEAAKKFAIRAAVGSVVGVASITIGLPILGFTSAGVAVGSIAAGIQAGIGNVAAGSLFAICQSIAAGGAAALPAYLGATGIGAVVGAVVGGNRRDDNNGDDDNEDDDDDGEDQDHDGQDNDGDSRRITQ